MDFDDELSNISDETITGSDELLSDDSLRLPESANPLVRLHAIRAWLKRRQQEAQLNMGKMALELQALQHEADTTPLRRRAYQEHMEHLQKVQSLFQQTQERFETYQEAEAMLEECVNHTTVGERLLVEYYLEIEALIHTNLQESNQEPTPRIESLFAVQNRIEHVGISYEED